MATLKAKQYPYYTVYKYDLTYQDLNTTAGTVSSKLLFYYPQRYNVAFVKLVINERWLGGAISSFRIQARPGGSSTYLPGTDPAYIDYNAFSNLNENAGAWAFNDGLIVSLGGINRGYVDSQNVANKLWLVAISVGGNTNELTQGSATLWVGTIPTF